MRPASASPTSSTRRPWSGPAAASSTTDCKATRCSTCCRIRLPRSSRSSTTATWRRFRRPRPAPSSRPAWLASMRAANIPTTYNWNLTIQRQLPFDLLARRRLCRLVIERTILYRVNQNAIPLGAAWLPQNQDPLNSSPKFDGTTSNQPNFYRPYLGYTNTTDYGFGANSNYHSLQVAAHRRFGRSVTFDVAYTWSKVMGTATMTAQRQPVQCPRGRLRSACSTTARTCWCSTTCTTCRRSSSRNRGSAKLAEGLPTTGRSPALPRSMTGQPVTSRFDQRHRQPQRALHRLARCRTARRDERFPQLSKGHLPVDEPVDSRASAGEGQRRLRFRAALHPVARRQRLGYFDLQEYPAAARRHEDPVARGDVQRVQSHPLQRLQPQRAVQHGRPAHQHAHASLGGTGGRFGFGALTGTADPRRIQLAAKFYF